MILYRGGCRSAQLALKTVKFHAIRPSIRTSVRRYLCSEHAESSVEPVPHPIEYGPVGSFTLEYSGALDLEIPSKPYSSQDESTLPPQLEMYDFKQQVYATSSPDGSQGHATLSVRAFPINSHPKASSNLATERDDFEELMNTEPPHSAESIEKSHPMRDVKELDLDIQVNHSELLKLLKEYREKSQDVPLDRIFELYYSLPSPRVCYLTRFNV